MKKNVYAILLLVCCSLMAVAQVKVPDIPLAGKLITADDKMPVAGATLLLKHQQIRTLSGTDGSFQLTAASLEDTLVITHVNYMTREMPVQSFLHISGIITLEKTAKELEAVVLHTGFQNISKEKAVGAFTKIDNAALNLQVGSNIINRLEGITPGVQFDKNSQRPPLTVRGLSSINGPKEPLIILDNFPYAGSIDNINPNDVESITILKDAAAASIWGTRAGNGVIVITTKSGKLNQPMKIEFNSNITVSGKPDLNYMRTMTSSDMIDVEQFLFDQGIYNDYDDLYPIYNYFPAASPVIDILLAQRRGDLSSEEATAQITALRGVDSRKEFKKYFYKPLVNQQYSINVQGGTKDFAYFLSGGYDLGRSNLGATSSRQSLSSRLSFRPAKALLITTGVRYTAGLSRSGAPAYNNIYVGSGPLYSYFEMEDENGNARPAAKSLRSVYVDTVGGGKLLDWHYYPLDDYKHMHDKTSSQDMVVDIGAQFQVMKGLSLDLKYQYESQLVMQSSLADEQSFAARDLVNTFSQINYATGTVTRTIPEGGVMSITHTKLQSQNLRGQLDYNRSWNKHQVAIMLGGEIRELESSGNSSTVYGFKPDILQFAISDHVNYYPTLPSGDATIPDGIFFEGTNNRFASLFANANYTYDNKYILFGSLRRDASNIFGVNTNDKWTPLWSAGLGWNISRESFFDVPALPYLKLRASYGFSGNADPSRSAVTTIFYNGYSSYSNFITASIYQYANPELRAEKVNTVNLGLDFETKGSVLSGSINYYTKKASDLFGPSPIDITNGLNRASVTKNVANMRGTGLELSLTSRNIQTRSFDWYTTFNLSVEKNKVTDYFLEPAPNSFYTNSDGNFISPIVGQPLFPLISYRWAGLDPLTGDPRGMLGKEISSDYLAMQKSTDLDNLVFHGSARPTVYGNLLNRVAWKGLSLSVNLSYQLGYYFRKGSISYFDLFQNGKGHEDYTQRWQQPGDELLTNVPSSRYPPDGNRDLFYNRAEMLVLKGDHVRLQFVNLSYELPLSKKILRLFDQVGFYMNASNLGIIWRANKDGIDPAIGDLNIPPPKTIAFGLRTNF